MAEFTEFCMLSNGELRQNTLMKLREFWGGEDTYPHPFGICAHVSLRTLNPFLGHAPTLLLSLNLHSSDKWANSWQSI